MCCDFRILNRLLNLTDYYIILRFLKHEEIHYPPFSDNFVPWLSVIDELMFNSPGYIKDVLSPLCHVD